MPRSLLLKARQDVQFFGSIGPFTAEQLTALGYDVPALEQRFLHQDRNFVRAQDDLRKPE